jgi:hypothetical protein
MQELFFHLSHGLWFLKSVIILKLSFQPAKSSVSRLPIQILFLSHMV